MSTSINVQVNGQTVTIKSGEKLEDIKKKLANPAEPIFEGVDANNNGKLDAGEIEKLKSNLESNNYVVEVADDGKTPRRAYNDAMQNLRNSYDSEKLGAYFKCDDADLHEVKKGETLYTIAKKQLAAEGLPTNDFRAINNRIAQIANLNGINDVNNIKEGAKLKVKLTDEAIQKVKDNGNDSAKAFNGTATADGDNWTNGARRTGNRQRTDGNTQANDGVNTDYKKKKTLVDGKTSTIEITKNGLNMGKGVPVDKDGNVLKDFKDPKYKQGGGIMKYTNPNHDPQEMYQISYGANHPYPIFRNVKLSASSITELKDLQKKLFAIAGNIKSDRGAKETPEAKAKRQATGLKNLKELIAASGGNEQIVRNAAALLQSDKYLDINSDECKAFATDLLLTRNANVVKSMTTNSEGYVYMSAFTKNREANETLAGMYQEIREKEKAGEKLTADEVKLKNALVNTMHKDGFKIDADEAKHVNEKRLNYNTNGELYYATYVDDVVYWASDEKLLDEFANKLKAADTDEKKAALFKEYAKTKDVELARCLLTKTKVLKAKDEDIKTVINANGMYVLDTSDYKDIEWSDDVIKTINARIKDIYTKDKGNLENTSYLYLAQYFVSELPEDEQEKAKTEIAETYFEKTTTKDEDGNDKVEYKFNPKRRPTKEEMEGLCNITSSDMLTDMQKALVKYTKLEDMGVGQYNETIERSYVGTNTVPHYGEMVDGMTDKKEVLDFIDNKIATYKNYNIPFDKILEKFPDDKDIKDKLLAYVDVGSTISDENRLALAKTYLKEENGKVSLDKSKLPKGANAKNVLNALPNDCKTGEAEKYFKAVLKELGKGDLERIKQVGYRNPKAVKARLAELVKANMSDKAFVQEVCKLDDSITPYQALYEVDANKAKWDDKTKQAVFEKIFNNRIKIKDKQKYLDGAVKSGLATKMAENRYIVGSNVYLTNGYNDTNKNNKKDENDTLSLRRMSKAGYENGAKLHGELKGAGSGKTEKMLKGEGDYKNFVTADNVAGLIQGFNDKSPKEGVMQYIANELATIPQATCNVIPNKLMEKAKALNLTGWKVFKDLDKFVKSHTDTAKGYSEDEGKQLDALINALVVLVSFKS